MAERGQTTAVILYKVYKNTCSSALNMATFVVLLFHSSSCPWNSLDLKNSMLCIYQKGFPLSVCIYDSIEIPPRLYPIYQCPCQWHCSRCLPRSSAAASASSQNNCDRLVSMDRDDSLYQSEAFDVVRLGVDEARGRGERPGICCTCCSRCCWLATAAFRAFSAAWVAEANACDCWEFPLACPPPAPPKPTPPPCPPDPCNWLTSSCCCWDRRFAATAATAAFWCCELGDGCCCWTCPPEPMSPEGAGRTLSNLRVSGLYIGCLNLQWVRRLSLRV